MKEESESPDTSVKLFEYVLFVFMNLSYLLFYQTCWNVLMIVGLLLVSLALVMMVWHLLFPPRFSHMRVAFVVICLTYAVLFLDHAGIRACHGG